MTSDPIRQRSQIQAVKYHLQGQRRLRDYALFVCGMNWALRVSDLLRLRVGDVSSDRGVREFFSVRQKKTGKVVRVPITPSSADALAAYLGAASSEGGHPAPASLEAPLFPSRERPGGMLGSLTCQQVHRIIRAACRESGLGDGTWATHTLRKTWGYHAHKSGAPLAVIQRKLGHRKPSVTLDYLGLTDDDVRAWSERVEL